MSTINPYDNPTNPNTPVAPLPGRSKFAVKRLDVISVGAMMGGLYVLIGLIVGAIFTGFTVLGVTAGGDPGILGAGIGAIIFLPIFYGGMGFVGGILLGILYNVVAAFIGGIKFDVE